MEIGDSFTITKLPGNFPWPKYKAGQGLQQLGVNGQVVANRILEKGAQGNGALYFLPATGTILMLVFQHFPAVLTSNISFHFIFLNSTPTSPKVTKERCRNKFTEFGLEVFVPDSRHMAGRGRQKT